MRIFTLTSREDVVLRVECYGCELSAIEPMVDSCSKSMCLDLQRA